MAINLDDYQELLAALSPELQERVRSSWPEAAKVFSARGLDNFLKGVAALRSLGKGDELVATWIDHAPLVAKEIGEDAVPDLVQTALSLASKTSGAVIELMLSTAPTAANRLGDEALFRAYLQFLANLLAQAPRGVRPMLENLEKLFSQLTLGGLRRWALWGAHAHRTNYPEQASYFSLQSKESQAMLQQERKGTLFIDVQRRINMYLRALWARDFFMKPTSGDFESREGYRPFVEGYFIHLPDAYDDFILPAGDRSAPLPQAGEGSGEGRKLPGLELYRAAAAHGAAHLVYTREPISAEALNPFQMAVISVIEDARVETLAANRFPGLRKLWVQLHTIEAGQGDSAGDFLNRLARALLDHDYQDNDPWIAQGRVLFKQAADRLDSNQISWDIGVQLAHEFLAKRIPFNPRSDLLTTPYRDDNRYFWEFEEFDFDQALAAGYEAPKQVRKHVSLMEFANELDVETAGDDAEEIWVLGTELFPYEDMGKSYNELEGKEPVSEPYHYAEWDYQIQLERPAWATVLEKRPKAGDLQLIDDITAQHKRTIGRLKFLLDALQPQGVTRIRKLEDGDELDVNAAIRAMIDMRMGQQPDQRIMMRSVRKVRDISVMVLLDLSESTNDKVSGQDYSVLDLQRQAAVLLADAIHKIGDPFAIHGFCSDGRHNVEYSRFKDFDQPYNEVPKSRLAGMRGQLSTRMGAAIRHAGHYLKLQKSAKKLLLVITDGEPADVDVRDPQYLRYDTKKAVEEMARSGVTTFCMSLDPRADQYVSRIFGARNYMVVDHVERLPEKLPALYAGLTR
ncbi:nitric oxide reductase activation protein NorD [Sideroxydans lithotrophicus]|uniref:von Willebrand factor type A n=1 Tax=Sideroxydans lithotrophicus (strain ES-1) TaxID=580332 RepID=D5CQ62_SIDLE|nr:nitric oxide reductase activation protein NorD [Sideroxydans lithotrophicus]ADE11226.1 von Willebrand factor type A [Sideroxydans lithotrophicus ES-1]